MQLSPRIASGSQDSRIQEPAASPRGAPNSPSSAGARGASRAPTLSCSLLIHAHLSVHELGAAREAAQRLRENGFLAPQREHGERLSARQLFCSHLQLWAVGSQEGAQSPGTGFRETLHRPWAFSPAGAGPPLSPLSFTAGTRWVGLVVTSVCPQPWILLPRSYKVAGQVSTTAATSRGPLCAEELGRRLPTPQLMSSSQPAHLTERALEPPRGQRPAQAAAQRRGRGGTRPGTGSPQHVLEAVCTVLSASSPGTSAHDAGGLLEG